MWSRRRVLALLTLGAGAAAGAMAGALVPGGDPVMLVPMRPQARIRRHFRYLDLSERAVDSFVLDHRRFAGPLPRAGRWPAGAFERFLLSTDFFQHGADERRRVDYASFYHPHVTPCYNPLARFD